MLEDALRPMVSDTKWSKMKQIVKTRTKTVLLVLDGCSDSLNVAAIVRSIDAFGVQFVDVIQTQASNRVGSKKHGVLNGIAKGSEKWVTMRTWDSVSACVQSLKGEGYVIWATDLQHDSKTLQQLCPEYEITASSGYAPCSTKIRGKVATGVAIVLGNEVCGISNEMRNAADQTFFLPMFGFVESFNVSVACGIVLSELLGSRGLLSLPDGSRPGMFTEAEQCSLLLHWVMQTLGQDRLESLATQLGRPALENATKLFANSVGVKRCACTCNNVAEEPKQKRLRAGLNHECSPLLIAMQESMSP